MRVQRAKCDNCQREWALPSVKPARDLEQRLTPGGIVPVGECPDPTCGALCYLTDARVTP